MVSIIVITEFGRHYSSYIAGMHFRASFLAFSYWLSTINCHAWTHVTIYSVLIGRGRGHETQKNHVVAHGSSLHVSRVVCVITRGNVKP